MLDPRLTREVQKPTPTPGMRLVWLLLVMLTAGVWGAIFLLALIGWGLVV